MKLYNNIDILDLTSSVISNPQLPLLTIKERAQLEHIKPRLVGEYDHLLGLKLLYPSEFLNCGLTPEQLSANIEWGMTKVIPFAIVQRIAMGEIMFPGQIAHFFKDKIAYDEFLYKEAYEFVEAGHIWYKLRILFAMHVLNSPDKFNYKLVQDEVNVIPDCVSDYVARNEWGTLIGVMALLKLLQPRDLGALGPVNNYLPDIYAAIEQARELGDWVDYLKIAFWLNIWTADSASIIDGRLNLIPKSTSGHSEINPQLII